MKQTALAYAQVRMQARHAARPTAAQWQVIETGRDFTQALDAVKRTSLAPLVARLGRESEADTVEQSLLSAWGELVETTASWVPRSLRPAVLWMKPLPHLRIGQTAWPPGLLTRAEAALLTGTPEEMADAWQREFARRLPARERRLSADPDMIWARFITGPARGAVDTAALATRMERRLRFAPLEPAALFAWLGLMALTIERLRGALLLSLLFAEDDPPEAS